MSNISKAGEASAALHCPPTPPAAAAAAAWEREQAPSVCSLCSLRQRARHSWCTQQLQRAPRTELGVPSNVMELAYTIVSGWLELSASERALGVVS